MCFCGYQLQSLHMLQHSFTFSHLADTYPNQLTNEEYRSNQNQQKSNDTRVLSAVTSLGYPNAVHVVFKKENM